MRTRLVRFVFVVALSSAVPAWAEPPALLDAAIKNWMAGKDDIAFTQRTRGLNDDGTSHDERVERYDPSQPDNQRWHLLEVDGQAPTPEQRRQWEDRKNRKPRKHANKPLGDLFDFDHAKVVTETPKEVRYAVGIRPEAARQVEVDKLEIEITVNKQAKSVERVTAGLREPARVAFGLAKILDADMDVYFNPPDNTGPKPGANETDGSARVVLHKLGDHRTEYEWSDFQRVTRHPSPGG
jgi:hypothetical protein